MRRGLIFIYLVLFTIGVKGQQIGLYDHYFYSPNIYNPAFTGNKETTNITLISRAQWSGFEGSPKLNVLMVDGSILDNKMGLGAILFSDTKGINKKIGGNLLYSYRININEESHLNFGVSLRVLSHSTDFPKAIVQDISDPTLLATQSKINFNGNLGFAYLRENLELGISMNQLLKSKAVFFNEGENDISYSQSPHYIGSLKYKFTLNEEKQLLLAPQALVRYVQNAPIQYEFNTNLHLENKFWVGAAYKSDYAVSVNAGISLLKKIDIGYSYDIIIGDISSYAGISHELMLNFKFGKKKEKIMGRNTFDPKEGDEVIESTEEETKEEEKELIKPKAVSTPTASVKDFIGPNGKHPKQGIYIITKSFLSKDNAINYSKTLKEKGYNQTNWFYSKTRKFNYVYMFKETNKKNTLKKLKEAKEKESPDAWFIILTE